MMSPLIDGVSFTLGRFLCIYLRYSSMLSIQSTPGYSIAYFSFLVNPSLYWNCPEYSLQIIPALSTDLRLMRNEEIVLYGAEMSGRLSRLMRGKLFKLRLFTLIQVTNLVTFCFDG